MTGGLDTHRSFVISEVEAVLKAEGSAWRQWVIGVLGPDALDGFSLSDPVPYVAAALLVHTAETEGRYREPPWLLALLGQLPQTPQVAELIAALPQTALPRPPSPVQTRWVRGMPFLDRSTLRSKLEVLLPEDGPAALLVMGPSKSGKSYTYELISHLTSTEAREALGRSFEVALVRVEPEVALLYDPKMLAEALVSEMGGMPTAPPRHSETVRWIHELANWVLAQRAQTGERWFWVLDGFRSPYLHEDTKRLVIALANRVIDGAARRHVRLVLLGYPQTALPGIAEPKILIEELGPPETSITELDVRRHVQDTLSRIGGGYDEGAVDVIVRRVVRGLPADDTRLASLCERLRTETQPLLEATP